MGRCSASDEAVEYRYALQLIRRSPKPNAKSRDESSMGIQLRCSWKYMRWLEL